MRTKQTASVTSLTFDEFYTEHRPRLVATLNAVARCGPDTATDAVDEAFVRALAHWDRVERMDAPAGWVFTVARNQLKRTRSRAVRERDLHARAVGDPPPTASPDADPAWELWDAVGSLPERERLAISLRYLADLTERQVAEVMGIAPGTVAATLHAARRRLAEQIDHPASEAAGPRTNTSASTDSPTEVVHDG